MRTNDVTLFSNGIGHFRRVYKVPAGREEKFSIPFKRDHIGDVAASLQVFGKVRLTTPPSFTPSNANATALHINQSEAYKSLVRSLSGAAVKVTFTNDTVDEYTLFGLDTQETSLNGEIISKDFIVLGKNGIVTRKLLCEVTSLEFVDESVRTEIDKALKNNFQTIKPDSTLLDIALTALGNTETEAMIQYTIPVAAWKMRYAIRQDKDQFVLEGAAIIDNNTDEDWDNFRVSVVTGNPISFNTDIATVCVPQRKTVRLVDGNVLGNVEVDEGYQVSYAGELETAGGQNRAMRDRRVVAMAACASPKFSTANYAQFGMGSLDQVAAGDTDLEQFYSVAEASGVESKEVGDFCVFTSKEPITILARKSAVVPMFTVPLSKAGVVLLYRESNHARRPYRTVKFKNETEYSLGKGKTVIYNEGVFSGECVLEAMNPGENRMLPYCLENGVKVTKEVKPVESRRNSIKISDGVGFVEDVNTAVSVYTIENKKDELFKLAIEHRNVLAGQPNVKVDFDGVEVKEKEKLIQGGEGYLVYFELKPKQSLTLTATESSVTQTRTLIGGDYAWLKSNVIDVKNPLLQDKQVSVCIGIQGHIDEVRSQINEAKARFAELSEQVSRVRENVIATKDVGNSATVAAWIKDLDDTEKELRNIKKKQIPELEKKLKELQAKLADELKKITASWKV
jgi:hypothetical protein